MKYYFIQNEKDAKQLYKKISLAKYFIDDYNDLYLTHTEKIHVCFKNIDIMMFLYYYILDNGASIHKDIALQVFSKRHILESDNLECYMNIPIPVKQKQNLWTKFSSLFMKSRRYKYTIQ